MVTLKQYLRDVYVRGGRVLEHPDYGGVNNNLHMVGSMHAKGRAGDINYGRPGAPPEEKEFLRWASRLADAAGLNVIYAYHRTHPIKRTNDNHKDHAHVDDGPIIAYRAPGADDALYRRILAEIPLGPMGWPTLKPGSTGAPVEALQRTLTDLGYRVTVDGDFGPGTKAAVIEAQRNAGLPPDAIVDGGFQQVLKERDWFVMATEAQLRQIVREEIRANAGPAVWGSRLELGTTLAGALNTKEKARAAGDLLRDAVFRAQRILKKTGA